MKVLHVYRTYMPDTVGGVQEAIRQIALATSSLGVENTIFSLSTRGTTYRKAPEGDVVTGRVFGTIGSCDFCSFKVAHEFVRFAKNFDLIHYHYPWPLADVLAGCLPSSIPFIVTYHSDIIRQKMFLPVYSPIRKLFMRRVRRLVATSPNYVSSSEYLNRPEVRSKLTVIPLTVGSPNLTATRGRGWDEMGFDPSQPFVLFVGEFRYYKGLQFLLGSAPLVEGNIVLVGKDPLGLAHQYGGLKNVFFLGQVEAAVREYLFERASALVLPSHLRSEAFGVVLLEASVRGIPMISCEINTGTSFVNLDEVTGLVVPPANTGALADAINRLLSNQFEREQFSKASKKRYSQYFSPHLIGRQYLELYRDVL